MSRNTPTEFVVLSRVVVFVLIVMPWWMGEGGMRVAGVCVEGCGGGSACRKNVLEMLL